MHFKYRKLNLKGARTFIQIWISDIRTQLQLHMYENVKLTTVNCVEGLHIMLCRPTEMEYFEVNQLKQSTQAIV